MEPFRLRVEVVDDLRRPLSVVFELGPRGRARYALFKFVLEVSELHQARLVSFRHARVRFRLSWKTTASFALFVFQLRVRAEGWESAGSDRSLFLSAR